MRQIVARPQSKPTRLPANQLDPSQGPSCRHSRCPRPLEVEPAQPTRHIYRFSNKEQPRQLPRLHRPRLQACRIHASRRHLGLLKSLRPNRMKRPPVQSFARTPPAPHSTSPSARPPLPQTPPASAASPRAIACLSATSSRRAPGSISAPSTSISGAKSTTSSSPARQYDDACNTAGPLNPRCVTSIFSLNRSLARQRLASTSAATPANSVQPASSPTQHQRHQCRPRLHHLQPKLPRQLVSKPRRPQLRNRQAPRSPPPALRPQTRPANIATRNPLPAAPSTSIPCAFSTISTPPRSHSASSISTIALAEWSQKSCPSVFSCHAIPYRSTSSIKFPGS